MAQAEATVQQVQSAFDAGAQPEFELLRARVTRDNQRPVVIRRRADRDIAMLRVKQLLDLPPDYDLRLVAPLEGPVPPPTAFPDRVAAAEKSVVVTDAGARTAVQEVGPAPRGLSARRTRRAASSGIADIQLQQRRVSVRGAPDRGLPHQLDSGRGSECSGVDRRTPARIGDGVTRRTRLRTAATATGARAGLARGPFGRGGADCCPRCARRQRRNDRTGERAFDIAGVRFQSGVSTQLELSDARLSLQQAEANRAQAARDLQVARARIALLPELPLGAGSASTSPRVTPIPSVSAPSAQQQPSATPVAQTNRPGGGNR
ncbi:hypothetical protein BH18ACI5_BH18ACI5_27380 [soil metagenome]